LAIIGFVLIAFTPGLFWLWFFLRQDIYRPEPRTLIALTFVLGCMATIPASIIEAIFRGDVDLDEGASLSTVAATMLLVVGPVEEVCKFAVVRLKPYRSRYFDEPMDGLVYAAAASLGFASLENLFYVAKFGPEVMIGRAPLSTVAHLVFGSIWGYALGVHHASAHNRTGLVVISLGVASIVHATFNVTVFTLPLAAVALVIGGGVWAFGRFKWGQRNSPFRYRRNYPEVLCLSCDRLIRVTSRFCRFCGVGIESGPARLFCGHCRKENLPNAGYCTGCGDRLLVA
jgi:RsiW-degrading membrane proteinase PrsW (M82 family)